MRNKSLLFLAITFITTSIYGGGKLVEPPKVPSISVVNDKWSGPYIGLQAGYIQGKAKIDPSYVGGNNDVTPYDKFSLKPSGATIGAFAGFNKLLTNNWLIGVEAAFNYQKNKKSSDIYLKGDKTVNNFTLKQDYESALYLRTGKVFGENKSNLVYLLAGVSGAKVKGGLKRDSLGTMWLYDTLLGWTAGIGYEYKVNQNWSLRAQYRFSKYEDTEFTYKPSTSYSYKVKVKDYKTHSVRVGFSYNFK